MNEDPSEINAALLALGSLGGRERDDELSRARGDADFAAKIEAWDRALAPIGAVLAPTSPPDDLLARIENRIDERSRGATTRADAGEWLQVAPGLRVKVLSANRDLRRQTILLEARPGAIHPPHEHEQDEEIYMISGDLQCGDLDLSQGDYHVSPAGTRHPVTTTRNGCLCLIIQAM